MTEQNQVLIAPILDAHLDPVTDVHAALIASGHMYPDHWLAEVRSFYPQALEVGTTSGQYRRMLVNRVLHVVLGGISHPKADHHRFLLIDQGSHEEWLDIIQKHVAPFLADLSKQTKSG